MGTFHGELNPISARSICEVCAVPVLLFGCENWILTDSILCLLESPRGDWALYVKTVKTSLHTVYASGSEMASVCKLSVLSKVCKKGNNIRSYIIIFLECEQNSLRLVQECRVMVSSNGHTDPLLSDMPSLNEIKREVIQAD